jgi:isopenicillin-N epimerase
MAGSMAAIRLDLPGPATREAAVALRARLLAAGTDAPVSAIDGGFWLRISAAAYNEAADYERLAGLLAATL